LDKSNARLHWRGPTRPTCPRWRSEILVGSSRQRQDPLRKRRAAIAHPSLFLILVGQIGQVGPVLKNPRLLASNLAACARTGGLAYSLLALRGLQASKVSPCPTSLDCHRTSDPRHRPCSRPTLNSDTFEQARSILHSFIWFIRMRPTLSSVVFSIPTPTSRPPSQPSRPARILLNTIKVFAVNHTRRMFPPTTSRNLRSPVLCIQSSLLMGEPMGRQHKQQPARSAGLASPATPPHTSYQPPWQGPPPVGIDAVVGRNALIGHCLELFAPWASNLALLNSEFVERVCECEVARVKKLLSTCSWVRWPFLNLDQCNVGPHALWTRKQAPGCSVELRYPCDVDARVLSIRRMPILCPDATSAMTLALACYPGAVAGLTWEPFC
jgi:hypothetical protein